MRRVRSVALLLVGLAVGSARPAHAQQSQADALRATAKASPGDANQALALGRALRRAGREADAQQELRRGLGLSNGRTGETAILLQWELARVAIARRDFGQAMVTCRVVGALPGGALPGHACAAEAHLLWKRASEALVETGQALAGDAAGKL